MVKIRLATIFKIAQVVLTKHTSRRSVNIVVEDHSFLGPQRSCEIFGPQQNTPIPLWDWLLSSTMACQTLGNGTAVAKAPICY